MTKTNRNLIILAIISFLGMLLDLLLDWIEGKIYGVDDLLQLYTSEQMIRHWQIIILVWIVVSLTVIILSKRKCQYDVFKPQRNSRIWQMVCGIALPLLFVVVLSFIMGGYGLIRNYKTLPHNTFVYQYIYYIFEMLLSGLIICLSQKVFDNVKKKDCQMPWGGVILGLSWGLCHILTKNFAVGLFSFVLAIVFGLIHNWLGKDLKWTWPVLFLTFASICS